ncbi:MAG: hypothetical protein RR287_06910 [Oscillospiraceae bacterium]
MITMVMFVNPVSAASLTATGGAYSMGGEFHNGDDVIHAADMWAMCGYRSFYNIDPTYDYLNSDRLNSYVLYFSAHGNQDAIFLPNSLRLTDGYVSQTSTTVEISDFNLTRSKLYVYDACLTASNGDGSGINLCTETIAAGADCVIGWTMSIGVGDAFEWQKRFQNQLASGYSVINAANYANRFSYNDNTSIKSWIIYGNQNIVIKLPSTSSAAKLLNEPEHTYLDYSNKKMTINSYNKTFFDSLVKSEYSAFTSDNYRTSYTYTNEAKTSYVVDYTYMNGEYSTNSGYTIIVQENKVIGMQTNNASVVDSKIAAAPEISKTAKDTAYATAAADVSNRNDGSSIVEQRGEAFYDVETGTYYYRVMTIYITAAGGYGAFFTFEKL